MQRRMAATQQYSSTVLGDASPCIFQPGSSAVSEQLTYCAVQGRMGAAQQYLSLVPGDAAPDVAELKDRIHRSGAPDVNVGPEPMFPFIAEDVAVDPSAVQQSSAYSQQAGYSQQPAYSQSAQAGELPSHRTAACTREPLNVCRQSCETLLAPGVPVMSRACLSSCMGGPSGAVCKSLRCGIKRWWAPSLRCRSANSQSSFPEEGESCECCWT